MNNQNIIHFLKATLYRLTFIFPLAFSFAVCFGMNGVIGVLFAAVAMIFMPETKVSKIMPVYLSFMITGYALTAHDLGTAFGAFIVCGILLILSSFFYQKIKKLITSPAVSGVMLATALTVTVLITTHYFGIGATGNNVREMIESYVSLGFHPNWRGVLYGTIVMVIMITFPRKFKSFSKTVSASFVAIVITLILNLFLNPPFMSSAINEIPNGDIRDVIPFILLRPDSLADNFGAEKLFAITAIGTALFVTSFYAISSNEKTDNKNYLSSGIANGIIGGAISFPLPYGINKEKSSLLAGITAAIIAALTLLFGNDILLRIPLHSCAVILIVGAWQSVKWGEIKKAFSGIIPIAVFTVSIISCLALNIIYGVIISAIISAFYSLKKES